jgi:hypothetical protein
MLATIYGNKTMSVPSLKKKKRTHRPLTEREMQANQSYYY